MIHFLCSWARQEDIDFRFNGSMPLNLIYEFTGMVFCRSAVWFVTEYTVPVEHPDGLWGETYL